MLPAFIEQRNIRATACAFVHRATEVLGVRVVDPAERVQVDDGARAPTGKIDFRPAPTPALPPKF